MSRFSFRNGVTAGFILLLVLGAGVLYGLTRSGTAQNGLQLPGFSLVKPAFAQDASPALATLEAEAGLSAYTRLASEDRDKVDLDKITRELFGDVIGVGDNYVIGKVLVSNDPALDPASASPSVFSQTLLYVDTDGWMIASLLSGRDGAEALTFYDQAGCQVNGPLGPVKPVSLDFGSGLTSLECSLGVAASFLGASLPADINWYHWEFTEATHLAVAGVNVSGRSFKNLYFAIPAGATGKDASAAAILSRANDSVLLDDVEILNVTSTSCRIHYERIPVAPFPTTGDAHTLKVSNSSSFCDRTIHGGIVLIYKFP